MVKNYLCEEGQLMRSSKDYTLKFIYSEKATKFCEISTLDLTVLHTVKSKVEISQNVVAFSEYMNFETCKQLHIISENNFFNNG